MWCLWRINSQQIEVLSTENYFPSSKKTTNWGIVLLFYLLFYILKHTKLLFQIPTNNTMNFVDAFCWQRRWWWGLQVRVENTHTHMDLSALSQIQWVVLGIYSVWCPDYPFNNPNSILLELPSLNKKKKNLRCCYFL